MALYGQSDLDFGTTSLYRPYYSSYDPIISKYKAKPSYYPRPTGSIGLFDDLDDLTLEVETNNLFTSRYRPFNHLNYVPSYYAQNAPNTNSQNFNSNQPISTSLQNLSLAQNEFQDDYSSNNFLNKSNQIPQQPPPKQGNAKKQQPRQDANYSPTYYQTKLQPIPFNNGQNQPFQVQAHNSQQQRLIQYQQRILQQQQQQQQQHQQNNYNENNMSELEILKLRQKQEKQQQQQFVTNQPFYSQFKNKQYSETSIPSTNADPLNSNNPTPPLLTQRSLRNRDFDKLNGLNNNNNKNNFFQPKFQYNNNNNTQKAFDDEPGSYLGTLKEARLREQRLAKDKYTTTDYKKYQKNFGLGRDFLPFETETKQEKLEKARKRDEYAKMIKERNTILSENAKFTNDIHTNNRRNPNFRR